MPAPDGIAKALREPLLKTFPAALLGRMVTIPYYPLSDEMVGNITRLQLGRIAKRITAHHKVPFTFDDAVVKLIVSRCTELESGGRMIDAVLTNTMLPSNRPTNCICRNQREKPTVPQEGGRHQWLHGKNGQGGSSAGRAVG